MIFVAVCYLQLFIWIIFCFLFDSTSYPSCDSISTSPTNLYNVSTKPYEIIFVVLIINNTVKKEHIYTVWWTWLVKGYCFMEQCIPTAHLPLKIDVGILFLTLCKNWFCKMFGGDLVILKWISFFIIFTTKLIVWQLNFIFCERWINQLK